MTAIHWKTGRMKRVKETKQVPWTGEPNQRAINYLNEESKVIVCPTKVGYIIAVSDKRAGTQVFSKESQA